MSDPRKEVAVLGATGYVGQILCRELRRSGWGVVAVTQGSRAFIVERLGVEILDLSKVKGRRFQHVVNLAYPTQGVDYTYSKQNREILENLTQVAADGATVVHTSTLAVFGMDLDLPISTDLAPRGFDNSYVESKAEMEHLLASGFSKGKALHMIRLGNVWGPGSPHWTANLLQRLVEGEPIGVRGADGFSNATDVSNVVSYIEFLLKQPFRPGIHVSHLAEFSAHRWNDFIHFLARLVHCVPVVVRQRPPEPQTICEEVRCALKGTVSLGGLGRKLWFSRRSGAILRRILAAAPNRVSARVTRRMKNQLSTEAIGGLSAPSATFLRLVSCPRQFESKLVPGWSPVVDFQSSLQMVESWARLSGYE